MSEADGVDGGEAALGVPPPRYRIDSKEGAPRLLCAGAPNLRLLYLAGRVVGRRLRRSWPRRSIFLDGACSGPPFLDNGRQQYSLDHHAGCIRAFTLAACEQAAVLVRQGLPLGRGEWRIALNALDADSVLAAWVLVNHAELAKDEWALLRSSMPLVRLEGAIDANGLDAEILAGLGPDLAASEGDFLKRLVDLAAGARGKGEAEGLAALGSCLSALDGHLIPASSLAELADFEETGRLVIAGDALAIACRSARGIYEAESFYKARYGPSLAILLAERAEGQYSLLQCDRFLRRELTQLYRHLNRADPAVLASKDAENRWGGSSVIGGSPRSTGSALSPGEILRAIGEVYGLPGGFGRRILEALGFDR